MADSQSNSAPTTSYREFLDRKSQASAMGGFEPLWLPDWLKPFQRHMTELSVRRGRSAMLADCGLGKGPMQLVWAQNCVQHTNRPALILAPLAVAQQFAREAEKFGIEAHVSTDGKPRKNITIANYERLHKFDPDDYSAVSCDEASILKHWSGATQKAVTRFLAKIQYRLLCTATAAPNDYPEMGTLSEALGGLTHSEMLATFFRQISDDEKRKRATADDIIHSKRLSWRVIQSIGQYAMKAHAFEPFWQWVASWALACRKPSDLGPYDDAEFVLPPLDRHDHEVTPRTPPPGFLFTIPAFGLNQERDERRRTIDERAELVADLTRGSDSAIVWCHLNPEGDRLEKEISGAVQVKGTQSIEEKEERILAFINGQARVLVTKAKIAGLGLNLQHCAHVVTFVDHCYDETTELLTKRGWLTFDRVGLTDDVATVNPSTLAFEWQRPTDVIWSPYHGPMVHFGTDGKHAKSFDLLVTPNHRMFVQRCPIRFPNGDSSWEFRTAEELAATYKRQEYRMLSAPVAFIGNELDAVEIPSISGPTRQSTGEMNRSGDRRGMVQTWPIVLDELKSIPIRQFMQLAGWYLSEGYCGCRRGHFDGQITITQTDVNPEHRREIIELLESIDGMNVYSKTKDIRCCSMQLALFLVDQFGAGSHHKRIPTWVKELSPEYLSILRDTMLKGDGCSNKRGGEKHCYRTVSKQLADDFAEICLKTGMRGSCIYHANGGNRYSGHGIWNVNIARQTLEPSINVPPEIIEYTGMIGCVSVPNGTLIVRRNGIPVVSGNSYERWYQCIRRCYRFGQTRPVRLDVIATEGEVNVRKSMDRKEKLLDQMFDKTIEYMNHHKDVKADVGAAEVAVPAWLTPVSGDCDGEEDVSQELIQETSQ